MDSINPVTQRGLRGRFIPPPQSPSYPHTFLSILSLRESRRQAGPQISRGDRVHAVMVPRSPSRDVQQLMFETAIQANANSKSLLALAEMDNLIFTGSGQQ